MPRAKGTKMKITLNQSEIEQALQNFIKSKLTVKDGIGMDIDLKATRGEAGYTAEIKLTGESAEAATAELAVATGRTQQQQPQQLAQPQVLNSNGPVEQPAASPAPQPVYPDPETPVGGVGEVTATEQPYTDDSTEPAGSTVDTQEKVAVTHVEQEAGPEDAVSPAEDSASMPAANPDPAAVDPEPAAQPVTVATVVTEQPVAEALRKPVVGLFANLKKPVNPAS